MKNYIEAANRTSAPVEPVMDRLAKKPQSLTSLYYILTGLKAFAAALDKWKAWAYYGKYTGKGDERGCPCPPTDHELRAEIPLTALENALGVIGDTHFLEILHAVIGIGSEAGEMIESILPELYEGKWIDVLNVHEESGDLCWYLAKLFKYTNTDFESVQAANIAKLRARYPKAFTEFDAQNRDLNAERSALESGADGAFLPTGKFVADSLPDDLSKTVFEALGEASMCWEPRPLGVFDSRAAAAVGARLLTALTPHLKARATRSSKAEKLPAAGDGY